MVSAFSQSDESISFGMDPSGEGRGPYFGKASLETCRAKMDTVGQIEGRIAAVGSLGYDNFN